MTNLASSTFCTIAYSLLVFSFALCAVLRMCNLWKRVGRSADELYPARRLVSVVYLVGALQFPVLLHPQSADAWLFARSFWVIYIPAACVLGITRYFSYGRRWRLRLCVVGVPPAVLFLLLFVFACAGGDALSPYAAWVETAVCVVGAWLAVCQLQISLWLRRMIVDFNRSLYSNEADFPKNFALGIIAASALALIVAWAVFLSGGGQYVLANFSLAVMLTGVVMLIVILHPQRVSVFEGHAVATCADLAEEKRQTEAAQRELGEEAQAADERDGTPCRLSQEMLDDIERRIREVVEGEKLFLDPELKSSQLDTLVGVNHYYLSITFSLRFGSYYKYVNTLRMEYALLYLAAHPQAKQYEVALQSGFGSLRSYQRIKRLYEEGRL